MATKLLRATHLCAQTSRFALPMPTPRVTLVGASAPIPAGTGLLPQSRFRPAPLPCAILRTRPKHQAGKKVTHQEGEPQDSEPVHANLQAVPPCLSEELAEIQTHAASARLSFSGYARQRLLLQPVSTHPPEELHRLRRDLAGLLNNVNQIARAIHTNAREPCKAAEEAARYAREAYDLMRRWDRDGV